MTEEQKYLQFERYNQTTHRIGRTSCALMTLLLLGAPFIIGLHFGAMPDLGAVSRAYLAIGLVWMISSAAEFLIYFPMLGAGGSYMSFITGNIINLKLPCAVNSRDLVGVKAGTPENEIVSTISIAVSALVTITILAIGVMILIPLQPILQAPVLQPAFDNVVPALFGALAYKYYRGHLNIALPPLLVMCILFAFVPGLISSTSMMIIPSGALAIMLAWMQDRKTAADALAGEDQ